ncbi:MAG: hypothetical protein RLZZ345_374, partial [Actinomycetota bacterium]
MVKKESSESATKEPTAKEPTAKKAAAKKPAAAKPEVKAAEKKPATKSVKKPASAEAKPKAAAKKKVSADETSEPKAKAKAKEPKADTKSDTKAAAKIDAAPIAVTATSMIFMAPDLPTPIIDKKRGRPVEDKKSSDQPESSVRRRSRRREGEIAEGEQLPPNTVVKVRTPREPKEFSNEPTRVKGSTRLEAKKQRRRDGRDAGRRRTTITESEFLARREAVERTMIVRSKDQKIQLGVLEDKVLVEHYVAKASEASLIGNVYLGKVQNVLPSMEAAFVDIGRGRNAVLYSGEVDWELAETGNQPRRIELALKSGDTVLVQVTKDPVGQKGARLTSQISLPGRYLVYVPNGSMNGISRKLPESERARLKKILKEVLPEEAGVIVRTASEGATEEQLTLDVQRL